MSWELLVSIFGGILIVLAVILRKDKKWGWLWKITIGIIPLILLVLLNVAKNSSGDAKKKSNDKAATDLRNNIDEIKSDITDAQNRAGVIEATNLQKIENAKTEAKKVSDAMVEYNSNAKKIADLDEEKQLKAISDNINRGS